MLYYELALLYLTAYYRPPSLAKSSETFPSSPSSLALSILATYYYALNINGLAD